MKHFGVQILVSLLLLTASQATAQGFKMHYSNSFADCFGAVEVVDYTNNSRVQFPGNYGMRDDFAWLDPDFHEVNSVWLRLEPNVKGRFEYIVTTDDNVDFGYYLFKAENNMFCEVLESKVIEPVLAEGLSYRKKGATDESGSGDFQPALEVEKEDVYYLMIYTNSTYKGHVNVRYRRVGEIGVTQAVVQDFRTEKTDNYIRVKIRDKETGEPIEANMIISGVNRDNYLFLGTDFYFDATTAREMHIESNTQGYFLFSKDFETKNAIGKNMEILLELEKLAPGKKLALENIKFEQDSDEFLPIALPALKRLLDFMAVNHDLRIEIQGHVNAPGYKNTPKIKNLSDNRAKAVKQFLKNNGIDSNRMVVEGYGNTQMVYEKPTAVWQEEANRRVEIKIIN